MGPQKLEDTNLFLLLGGKIEMGPHLTESLGATSVSVTLPVLTMALYAKLQID